MGTLGLRQRIAMASSVAEVSTLLFQYASRRTRSSWKNAAGRRNAFLKGEKPPAPPAPVEEEYVEVKPKKKKKL